MVGISANPNSNKQRVVRQLREGRPAKRAETRIEGATKGCQFRRTRERRTNIGLRDARQGTFSNAVSSEEATFTHRASYHTSSWILANNTLPFPSIFLLFPPSTNPLARTSTLALSPFQTAASHVRWSKGMLIMSRRSLEMVGVTGERRMAAMRREWTV